jgi:hypothetical protein
MAFAAMSAASARSREPAAARDSAPFRPPPRMFVVDRPALASSSSACAASEALKLVSLPAWSAAARSWPSWPAVASATAPTWDICLSKLRRGLRRVAGDREQPDAGPADGRRDVVELLRRVLAELVELAAELLRGRPAVPKRRRRSPGPSRRERRRRCGPPRSPRSDDAVENAALLGGLALLRQPRPGCRRGPRRYGRPRTAPLRSATSRRSPGRGTRRAGCRSRRTPRRARRCRRAR